MSWSLAAAATGLAADGPPDRDIGLLVRPQVDRVWLDASLALGREFLLANQTERGNFRYAYDLRDGRDLGEENQVRQAGALWGLALLHADQPTAGTRQAVERGLTFFEGLSRRAATGRFIAYPGAVQGELGTVALVSLALQDYLHLEPQPRWQALLDDYLAFLRAQQRVDGSFYARYLLDSGEGWGTGSPYFDGETLLVLARAARQPAHAAWRPTVLGSADALYTRYVREACRQQLDANDTKGFFQWGILAFAELWADGASDTRVYGPRIVELAHWMLDVHRPLERRRNTAYALEGLAVACETARALDDLPAARKFAAGIDQGLARLLTWQVDNPRENDFLRQQPRRAAAARGGVLNAADDPELRIDVTQHQLHALLLARRLVYVNRP